ncbi:hypothetical protein D3C81_1781550 [compost metagenome]
MGAVGRFLPLVAGAQHAPVAQDGGGGVLGRQLQFGGLELAAQADLVGDAHGFVEALGPDGQDLFDLGPGADAFNPDLLALLELCARHAEISPARGQHGAPAVIVGFRDVVSAR